MRRLLYNVAYYMWSLRAYSMHFHVYNWTIEPGRPESSISPVMSSMRRSYEVLYTTELQRQAD